MRLVLVRHAEPAEEARGRCYGRLDVGLSPNGRLQCDRLARRLAGDRVDSVVSSPRHRALETARAIARAHDLVPTISEGLQELDFGDIEGRSYDEIAASHPRLYAQWMSAPTTVRFPGGESYDELRRRVGASLATLREAHAGERVVAVTHGGVIRAVLAEILELPSERVFRLSVDPASITRVEWLEGEPVVRVVNSVESP
jgi:alpha-ribazole phosphatase